MLLRRQLLAVVLLCTTVVKVELATIVQVPKATNPDWWNNAVIYQIYTRSFRDSSNDGIGDISGIVEKLDYLRDAGVTAIWLPPVQKSADEVRIDFGYEVTDYREIDAEYGTVEQFKDLIRKAHELGIKIIIELVPNHTSNKHEWFIASSQDDQNEYADYYVWLDNSPSDLKSNWISHFNKPAWTYSRERKEWYLHQFGEEQPDLNYHNPVVRTEMINIIKFWLETGVDGFVMSDVPYLAEDPSFPDEPPSGTGNEGDYESLRHDYTSNQDKTYEIVSEWRKVIDEYSNQHPTQDPRILVTKAHTNIIEAMLYCGKEDLKGAHFTYNYLLTELSNDLKAQAIFDAIETWVSSMPKECTANWVLGNHDLHRVATRYGSQMVDGLNMLLAFLPGIMITYNGEEIGQENGNVKFSECKDPIACEDESTYHALTKDHARTPFHWDDSTNAGFNAGSKPWLPVSDKYLTNNAKQQNRRGYSTYYNTYRALTDLRQNSSFINAALTYTILSEHVFALIKEDVGGEVFVGLISSSDQEEKFDLSQISKLGKHVKVIVATSSSKKHNRVLSTNSIVLNAYESIIVKALPDQEEGRSDWWEHAMVYQIYPLSFKDQNNDGFGDLQGIIGKLPYLQETGVTAAWLSPICKSGGVDAGYDISDYREIDERFGTFEDFAEMVEKAHALGIKIVMDFVPNHSSDQHEWFVKSENREPGYEDFYIWHKGTSIGRKPPNNWISLFKGSAWTKSETRKEWYLHQFAKEQPDLNYRNPLVVAEMKDILKFWMDKGVDGFRMDAVPYLLENDAFEDEPPSNVGEANEHGSLIHIHTSDQPGTFDMIYQWREYVDDYTKEHGGDARILMSEAYTDIENTMKYYGDENRDGAHFTFNFQLITRLNIDSNARHIQAAIDEWLQHMPTNRIANWVLGNHDNHRVATRFNYKNVDGLNMLIALLPGVMVTYNGEEIGQENGQVSWSEGKDPSACNGPKEDFKKTSRDFARTPFQWNNSINAGFNDGFKPWLPVGSSYKRLNLAEQNVPDKPSHYNIYKQLIELRNQDVITKGAYKIKAISNNVLTLTRKLPQEDTYILYFNVGNDVENIQIDETLDDITPYVEIKVASSESFHSIGELIPSEILALNAHEAIIVTTTLDEPTTPKPGEGEGEGGGGGAAETTISITLFIGVLCSILYIQL